PASNMPPSTMETMALVNDHPQLGKRIAIEEKARKKPVTKKNDAISKVSVAAPARGARSIMAPVMTERMPAASERRKPLHLPVRKDMKPSVTPAITKTQPNTRTEATVA